MKKKNIIISLCLIGLIVSITFLLPNTTKKTYAAGTTLVDVVKGQSNGDSWASGAKGVYYTNGHEYRYVGAEVDNYVKFNNDMYRIIGVFDSNTHGVTDGSGNSVELVKLIRSRILGAYSWGVYNGSLTSGSYSGYKNDWTGNTTGIPANANVLLNQFFYNKNKEVTGYSNCSTWTYYHSGANYRTNDCSDIVGYGIGADVRDYIENVTWHLKGKTGNGFSKQDFYTCERSGDTTVTSCNSGNSGAYAKSTTGKIGLMYASDYMYASGYFGGTDTTSGSYYYYGNQNWLYKGYEWMITPDGDSADLTFIVDYGFVGSSTASFGGGVRPTLYLKSSVYITGGNGSFSNPYTISCDDCSS